MGPARPGSQEQPPTNGPRNAPQWPPGPGTIPARRLPHPLGPTVNASPQTPGRLAAFSGTAALLCPAGGEEMAIGLFSCPLLSRRVTFPGHVATFLGLRRLDLGEQLCRG
ncbi:hypothetical protein BaRGS_00003840 [Batillaria attramentaria]|uniref:Uncharacterized protein n=1 Tax=Batillaria attramentaria TaxID=370345 RepID=A0ABD0LZ74_9CAEN